MNEMPLGGAANVADTLSEGVQLTDMDVTAIRILIDHARAAAPEDGDLEALVRSLDHLAGIWASGRTYSGSARPEDDLRSILRRFRAAPSVAAPPREDEAKPREGIGFSLIPVSSEVAHERAEDLRRTRAMPDGPPKSLILAEAINTLACAITFYPPGAAPGTVRDPERET